MPLYEYECFVCKTRFERIQRVSAEPVRECPECGGPVRRLLGAPALQFKGSGWYVTDYGKGNGAVPAATRGESAKESKPEKDTSGDTGGTSSSDSSDKGGKDKKAAATAG